MTIREKISKAFTLSDTQKVSDNVGSVLGGRSPIGEGAHKLARAKTNVRTTGVGRTVSMSDQDGTTTMTKVIVGQLPSWLRKRHTAELLERWQRVENEAVRTEKPAGIIADNQIKAILKEAGKTQVSATTEKKYLRAVALMMERKQTPLEASSTPQHWNFLRSAMRFYLVREIERTRQASEVARKAKNMDSAKRRTRRAFELATVFDELFLSPSRQTWADKAKSNKALGIKTPRKSKRFGPRAPTAMATYVNASQVSEKLTNRHAERLFILGLFGVRPAELMNKEGVRLTVEDHKNGPRLVAKVFGAKVDEKRGIEVRLCGRDENGFEGFNKAVFMRLVDKVRDTQGGLTVHTSNADYRSLNRLLAKLGGGLSCYSYRHAVASDLKASGVDPVKSASFLGHRSTRSLASYGRRSMGRGARGYSVKASERSVLGRMVRVPSVEAPRFPCRPATKPSKPSFSKVPRAGPPRPSW